MWKRALQDGPKNARLAGNVTHTAIVRLKRIRTEQKSSFSGESLIEICRRLGTSYNLDFLFITLSLEGRGLITTV